MFPYFEPQLELRGFQFPIWTLLVVLGVAVGYGMLTRRARARRLDSGLAAQMVLWMALAGFVVGHLVKLLYLPELGSALQTRPWIVADVFHGQSSFGWVAGGILAGLLYLRRRMPYRQVGEYLGIAAYVLPFGCVLARLGCALAHDHPGLRSHGWLAVRYPGGSRYDLGLLDLFPCRR